MEPTYASTIFSIQETERQIRELEAQKQALCAVLYEERMSDSTPQVVQPEESQDEVLRKIACITEELLQLRSSLHNDLPGTIPLTPNLTSENSPHPRIHYSFNELRDIRTRS